MEALEAVNFGWMSILPPLIAIILALITKEVLSSLLVGVFAGALIYSGWNPIEMVTTTVKIMGEKIGYNANILIFLGLLGAIVVVVTMAGGSRAYGAWASTKLKTRKGAAMATSALGVLIFIDDYFNCLTVGTVMRPVTDKHRISRAKLAYILDATAAPVCIIAPISSWGASVASYMGEAGVKNGMAAFLQTIPYNLYAICTVVMVAIICLSRINFGSMAKFEKIAIENGDVHAAKKQVETESFGGVEENKNGKVIDLVLPIGTLIVLTILAMLYTGGMFVGKGVTAFQAIGATDASLSLVLGGIGTLIFTLVFYSIRKVLGFKDFMGAIATGVKSMVPAYLILILAWSIGGICSTEYLNVGGFVGHWVNDANFPVFILPAVIFVVAGFLAFATGTSWGTMALLIPIGAAICITPDTQALLIPIFGSILAGAVYGDHVSPISDTTILSSTGAGCNHMDHVSSQLPYATLVAGVCVVGYFVMGIVNNAWLPLIISLALMIVAMVILSKFSAKKNPIRYQDK
ncbi:Na+/H+ antiporter NhaC family protein [Paludicola sp. MB14-C6]|uniref:Na+/H+ antiporter NhaC family protein n=1 Tax=Paludihabitans sp. MB14-C6 TaxID=3070656 RepID=UPI0027DB9E44|nr:Na+/H+ antiporter NhaC family protein [Paludicola sp. MB14-C6]WMJ21831.1 Na+/H+ antiporter NhaC family protein [Paludicola sp. MB14-C6]